MGFPAMETVDAPAGLSFPENCNTAGSFPEIPNL